MKWFFIALGLFVVGVIGFVSASMATGSENNIVSQISMVPAAIGFFWLIGLLFRKMFRFLGKLFGNSDSGFSAAAHIENRKNYPNKCISCIDYSNAKKECRHNGKPMSEMDSCDNWH